MVQGKKQLNSKPKFAEVVVGDNEVNEMVNNKALASMIKADIRNRLSRTLCKYILPAV